MINLLPPQVKQDLQFAHWNALTVHYLKIVIGLMVVLGAAFGGTYFYLSNRIASADTALQAKQDQVAHYKPLLAQAKALNSRVAAIKAIQDSQPKFSLLLDDIAKFTLKGTSLTNIALTGDDTKPVQISATADTYTTAVSLRDALASSPRVSGADIVSISSNNGAFTATIIIGFKPGRAR